MQRLPRFIRSLPAFFGAPAAAGHSERPLRLLLAASLLLPICIFAIASFFSYWTHVAEARDRLERTLGMVHEHAVKVFETFEISERYMEELLNGLTDDEIRADEKDYSARLDSLQKMLPQLRDLCVIGGDGRPIVSGTIFPMPRNLDLSDREFFSVHKTSEVATYISEVVEARAAATNFFAITRKRPSTDGRFNGVYLISIAPEYFVDFYSRLPNVGSGTATLLRADGAILARYPELSTDIKRLPAAGAFMKLVASSPQHGDTTSRSVFDSRERILFYRKLPQHEAYVVAGVDTATIRADWIGTMTSHLIFGLPAMLTMFTLGLMTLRRGRREAIAYSHLREETTRRESTEQALRQAQKMEAVGRLTGGIAHDFNNLLTAIMGNVDLALRRLKTDDDRIPRSLNAARQASQRAATLVQRLLTFSRQHPQEVRAIDINRLVQGMSELLHRTLGEAVTIETSLASGLWKAALDPNQLENAIVNLAVNARDAMPGGGTVTIATSNAVLNDAYAEESAFGIAPGQYVLVEVNDSGTGMSAEVRDKAFEPFFTTKPVGAGSGLGLSMVYGFVKQSSGHLRIDSIPDQGTSVKLYFQRLVSEAGIPSWSSAEPATVKMLPARNNESILLVEDDDHVRQYVAEALRDLGYRVKTAPEGATALNILKHDPGIILLFTDVVLPGGMNGRQLADEALALFPKLKVIFASGYTRDAIVHDGRLDPAVELLAKPFTPEALAEKVRQVLDS